MNAPPRRPRVPAPLVLAAGMVFLALGLTLTTALNLSVVASFDETVYKVSAAQYATGGLDALLDDRVARGVARLYSLLIAPFFLVFDGDVGVRAARAFGTVLWALTAIPVFLLARRVMTEGRAAGAALLSILVPWATISTVLFSEALAYPLFATALLAMVAQLRRPTPGKDVLVLVLLAALVATRVQFFAMPVAWLVLVIAFERRRAPNQIVRRHPALAAALASLLLVALVALVSGVAGRLVDDVGGPYVAARESLPADVGLALLFEIAMLALGTGLIPFVLAVVFARDALRGRLGDEALRLTVVCGAMLAAVFGVAVLGTSGWPGADIAEERYYLYGAPVILVAALAALDLERLRASTIAWGGAGLAVLLSLAPVTAGLSLERAFLVPVAATSQNVASRVNTSIADALGLEAATGQRDLWLVLVVVVTVLSILAFRRARWAVLVPAVVLQLAFGGYALATMHGKVPNVPGGTGTSPFAASGWLDRATEGGPTVTLLGDRFTALAGADLGLTFFNDEVGRHGRFPGVVPGVPAYPISALPKAEMQVGDDLTLEPGPGSALVVVSEGSPFVQLAGRRVAAAPSNGSVLLEVAQPPRASWVARGLGGEGELTARVPIGAEPARVVIGLDAPPGTPGGTVRGRLGSARGQVDVPAGAGAELRLDACGEDGPSTGALSPSGVPPATTLRVRSVRLEPC